MRIHLDTDIGGDIDDLCALAMVLNWPDAELIGVTTVSDDHGKRAGYAKYALGLAGRQDIPVAAGADVSVHQYRWWPGLPDEATYWPEPIPAAPTSLEDAVSLLERSIEQDAVIAAIGPFTNLALLEKRSPGILRDAKLFLMGGYVFPPRQGYPALGSDMDYNVQADAGSAHYVIERSNPTLITLSVTVETSLRRSHLDALRRAGALGQLLARQAEAFARDEQMEAKYGETCEALPDDIINFLHDPLACAIALGWNDCVWIKQLPLRSEIKDGWLSQTIAGGHKPTKVVTALDGDRFSDFWLRTVAQEREPTGESL
jgi:inosine-uridine nucleoside N-ribohydrolase